MPWNCLWGYEPPGPECHVSGPLQLLLQKEGVGQAHAWRSKSFRKARPCHWCHQPVSQGSCCRVCKYVCHTACEKKVSESLEPPEPPQLKQPLAAQPSRLVETARGGGCTRGGGGGGGGAQSPAGARRDHTARSRAHTNDAKMTN
ncbi:hypothetical protein JYU34_002444 [Plutella xylostella]|uniref:Phorbol-ester/DAG-type domain-containing protein n=1 Tax=Plutella xylostella TaxID=51655 RepID=A0ABQ7R2A4_PLUXY|nr:hypothetical protein JYU34_002444 [Plutella xylostella]